MNTNILQKCVEELKKESPRLDYVLGMLETLIDGNFTVTPPTTYPMYPQPSYPSLPTNVPYIVGNQPLQTGSGLVELPPVEDSYATRTGPVAQLG